MYGKEDIDVHRSSCICIADVVEGSCCGASPRAALSAEGTGSVLSIASPPLLVGQRQIVNLVHSDAGIGAIITGTGHNESILTGIENGV